MLFHEGIRRPWTAAVDAALVLPATSILPQRRIQLLAVAAADEK
jgi:hypothetical protein